MVFLKNFKLIIKENHQIKNEEKNNNSDIQYRGISQNSNSKLNKEKRIELIIKNQVKINMEKKEVKIIKIQALIIH